MAEKETGAVFVWIRNQRCGADRQKWNRPFVGGMKLNDERLLAAHELPPEHVDLDLDHLEALYPNPAKRGANG